MKRRGNSRDVQPFGGAEELSHRGNNHCDAAAEKLEIICAVGWGSLQPGGFLMVFSTLINADAIYGRFSEGILVLEIRCLRLSPSLVDIVFIKGLTDYSGGYSPIFVSVQVISIKK